MKKKTVNKPFLPGGWLISIAVLSILLPMTMIRSERVTVYEGSTDFYAGTNAMVPYDGVVERVSYGYPLEYRHSSIFVPSADSGATFGSFSNGDESQYNVQNVIMNAVFWFALMHFIVTLYRRHKN